MKKVFITGANGYVGSNLVEKFKRRHMEYDIIEHTRQEIDLTDIRFPDYYNGCQPDVVIHTAAKANSVEYQNSKEVLYNNIIGTQNLIEAFPDSYHIFFSSIVVYNSAARFFKCTSKIGPKSVYGASKAACENLYSAAKSISGTKSCILRPCAIVGGNNYTHGLINAIINKIKDNPTEIELFGKRPGTIKPYIHIDDIYRVVSDIVKNPTGYLNETVLATQNPLSVEEVAKIIFKKFGVNPKINWRPDKVWKGDNKKINYKDRYSSMSYLYRTSEEAIENMDKEYY